MFNTQISIGFEPIYLWPKHIILSIELTYLFFMAIIVGLGDRKSSNNGYNTSGKKTGSMALYRNCLYDYKHFCAFKAFET